MNIQLVSLSFSDITGEADSFLLRRKDLCRTLGTDTSDGPVSMWTLNDLTLSLADGHSEECSA
jgi:hypothetical protein